MKLGEGEQWLRENLLTTYDAAEAANIAAWVFEKVTGLSRLQRVAQKDEPMVVQQLHHLTEYAQRLQRHEPVQYILGECHFAGLTLYVNEGVLIPRPETEELVAWITDDVQKKGLPVFDKTPTDSDKTDQLKILDVGTGSGCIALALKNKMPLAEVWACDISDKALNIARRNGAALDIRVDFVGIDFLNEGECRQLPTVDIIVSNPPYIPASEKEKMQPNVVQHEPHTALFVPDNNPFVFYEALARFGKKRLYKGGAIYAEIHEDKSDAVAKLFEQHNYSVQVKKDMQGKNRMVKAELLQNTTER